MSRHGRVLIWTFALLGLVTLSTIVAFAVAGKHVTMTVTHTP